MAENSKIEWCDHTFNPWIGCTKVSPGCDHCYAEVRMDRRLKTVQWGPHGERKRTSPAYWREPLRWDRKAATAGVRHRVFCASLADVFDNKVPAEWRADMWALIEATPNLDWLLLTKRPGNIGDMLPVPFDFHRMYPNVWLGCTVTSRDEMLRDGPKLAAIPAQVHFWSVEPMLGDLGEIPRNIMPSWVIVGGESGPHARPMHPDWARDLRDQCAAAGVPYFFKQWGEWGSGIFARTGDAGKFAVHWQYNQGRWSYFDQKPRQFAMFGSDARMTLVGKTRAGRLLDGAEHSAMPEARR